MHSGVERVTTGIGRFRDAMAQVLHLDARELGQGIGESLRAVAVGNLDRELVHGSGTVSLEDVYADEVPAEFTDLGGDLAEGSWPVREPQSDDHVAKHGVTVGVKCERRISAVRTPEEPGSNLVFLGRDGDEAGDTKASEGARRTLFVRGRKFLSSRQNLALSPSSS
jgi:hypothetical protein